MALKTLRWCGVAALLLAGCGDNLKPESMVVRVTLSPPSRLLGPNGSAQLVATAYDTDGNELDVDFEWTSLEPDVVSVSSDGLVTAEVDLGSTQITATAGGITSTALLYVAEPAPGVVLIDDEHVVSGPTPVDETASFDVGMALQNELSGLDELATGTLILGTGGSGIGGRVTSSSTVDENLLVTWDVVPLAELYASLKIQETLDLRHADFDLHPDVAAYYTVERPEPGRFVFTPRPPETSGDQPLVQGTRALGPFECESEAMVQLTGGASASFELNHDLSLELQVEEPLSVRRVLVGGSATLDIKAGPKFSAAFEGALSCKGELFYIPASGPPVSVGLPLGGGIELKGKVSVAEVGLSYDAKATAMGQMGYDCPSGGFCDSINTLETGYTGQPEWILPDPTSQARIELEASAFARVELAAGLVPLRALMLRVVEARAGIKQDANLAPTSIQLADPRYASAYAFGLFLSAGPGESVENLFRWLSITALKLEAKLDIPISVSPKGNLSGLDSLSPGQRATATIDISDGDTYLTIYNIEEMLLVDKDGAVKASVTGEDGAQSYDIDFTPLADEAPYSAMVVTTLLPGWPLELASAGGTSGLCDEAFGTVSDYLLCAETITESTTTCRFYNSGGGSFTTCDAVCGAAGGTCAGQWGEGDNDNCTVHETEACGEQFMDAICECEL